jgi:hypothetical protein
MSVVTRKRFTIDEYHRLIELGFFQEGDRVELIQRELMQMVIPYCSSAIYVGSSRG